MDVPAENGRDVDLDVLRYYQLLFYNAPQPIVIHRERKVVDANRAAVQLLGFTERTQVVGRPGLDFIHPDDHELVLRRIECMERTGESCPLDEIRLCRADGEIVFVEISSVPVEGDGGVFIQDAVRDVTERKRMEEALEAERSFTQQALDNLQELFFVFDPQWRPIRWNRLANEVTGLTDVELRELRVDDLVASSDHDRLSRAIETVLLEGRAEAEFEIRHRSGTTIPFAIAASLMRSASGEVIGICGTGRDISAQRKVERALRTTSERYYRLVDELPIGITLTGLDGYPVEVNPALEKFLGYNRDELRSMRFSRFTHPEDLTIGEDLFERLCSGTRTSYQIKKRYIRKDGTVLWGHLSAALIRDEEGQPSYILGIIEDITTRKAAEEALARSELKFRELVEKSPAGIYIIQDDRFVYVNPAFARMLGYPAEEIVAFGAIYDIIFDADRPLVRENVRLRMSGALDSVQYDVRLVKKDGALVHLEVSGVVSEHEGRTAIIGTALDITERVRAEKAVQESRQHLNLALEAGSMGMLELDFEKSLATGDERTCAILGIREAEGYSCPIDILVQAIHPDDQVALGAIPGKNLDADRGVTYENEFRVIWKDGTVRWVQYLGRIIFEQRRPVRLIGMVQDITDHKHAIEQVLLSETRYHALSRLLLSYGVSIRIDDAGRRTVEWITDTVKTVFGYEPEEMKAIDLSTLVHPDDYKVYEKYRGRLSANEAASMEFRARRKDGEYRWIRTMSIPEWDAQKGRIVRVNGAGQDITELKQIQLELLAAKEKAEEMNRLKDSFLANMSHEIRTPLTSIIGFSDVLLDVVEGEALELLKFIHLGGQRLLETLNSVLDLAQLRSGTIRLNPEYFDVVSEVQVAQLLFQEKARQQGLDITIELNSKHIPEIYADRSAFGRVMNNLLSNALKFTKEGRVLVRIGTYQDAVQIEVEDTGIGISDVFLPHLFQEFRQESTGHSRSHEGNGLGLTITRELVDLMHGQITVRSRKGEGSTFTVVFPASDAGEKIRDGSGDVSESLHVITSGQRILVLDDDPHIGTLLRHWLGTEHEVHVESEVPSALEQIRNGTFDLLLLDINLGGDETGEDVLRILRNIPGYERIPVVALTAYALPGDDERFLKAGFDGYVSKPFTRNRLIRSIAALLSGTRSGYPAVLS